MLMRSLLLFLLITSTSAGFSQAEPSHSSRKSSVDVFGGYVYGSGNSSQSGGGVLGGIDVDKLYKWLGLTVEFDLTKASNPPSSSNAIHESNVLVGPRFAVPVSNSSPVEIFVDGLIGTDTFHNAGQPYTWGFNNRTTLAWAFDGGLDIRLSRHFALRGQAGVLGTSLAQSTDGNPGNGPTSFAARARAGGALVFRF